ncbi:MAG TPA: sulfur oxidation c-type cytochrome SoxX [Gammaproteobacteria bacterium]
MLTSAFGSVIAVLIALVVSTQLASAADASVIAEGKKIAFDKTKGNCLACHAIEGGELPGNIGPPLVEMKARFPDKAKLHAQIWDSTSNNPNSMMPPFGRHEIMTDSEIEKVVEFIYSL